MIRKLSRQKFTVALGVTLGLIIVCLRRTNHDTDVREWYEYSNRNELSLNTQNDTIYKQENKKVPDLADKAHTEISHDRNKYDIKVEESSVNAKRSPVVARRLKDLAEHQVMKLEHSMSDVNDTTKEDIIDAAVEAIQEEPQAQGNSSNTYTDRHCDNCFSRPYEYLLNPTDLCTKHLVNRSSLDVLILVPTKPDSTLLRSTLRQTWLSVAEGNASPRVRYAFLIGRPGHPAVHKVLAWEQNIHSDMIQQDFRDSYYNLTTKTMMGLAWAVEHCSHARVIVKVDADVFVNTPQLLETISRMPLEKNMRGVCSKWSRPIRSSTKWRITVEEYDQAVYPPFCHGPHYILPMHIARAVLRVAPDTPPFHLEDVYLGTCLHKTPYRVWSLGALYYRIDLNKIASNHTTPVDCDRIRTKVLARHGTKPESAQIIWDTCFSKSDTRL